LIQNLLLMFNNNLELFHKNLKIRITQVIKKRKLRNNFLKIAHKIKRKLIPKIPLKKK